IYISTISALWMPIPSLPISSHRDDGTNYLEKWGLGAWRGCGSVRKAAHWHRRDGSVAWWTKGRESDSLIIAD
ncbi:MULTISPECIES: hypothetical protein, partial [Pseudomonas]|uniref:hypothetical protein n=1 Tax=Pseudomonas TaxID=286 RepID=UPI002F26A506